ncbi:MAG TPA: gamma-glutamylcyclotransferase family protein [Gammaproteobacteria bacterium]|nr:gamma-glutamylcyclotransferase family protein [Gammaproteobacteria bacterium]
MSTRDGGTVKYFAYGSNMSTQRLRERTPSAIARGAGYLVGYDLRFHKRSTDGSGKADALYTGRAEDVVWGVVFELAEAELAALDTAERGYRRVAIDVLAPRGCLLPGSTVTKAITYLAEARRIDATLRPFDWYKTHVVDGAREHGLPAEYLAKIEAVEARQES